jgi:hypothetical protein
VFGLQEIGQLLKREIQYFIVNSPGNMYIRKSLSVPAKPIYIINDFLGTFQLPGLICTA